MELSASSSYSLVSSSEEQGRECVSCSPEDPAAERRQGTAVAPSTHLSAEPSLSLFLDPRGEAKFLKPLRDRAIPAETRLFRVGDCQIESGGVVLHRIERKQLPDLRSSFSDSRFSKQMQAMMEPGALPPTDGLTVPGNPSSGHGGLSQESGEITTWQPAATLLIVCPTKDIMAGLAQPYLRRTKEYCDSLGVQLVHVSGDDDVIGYYSSLYTHYRQILCEGYKVSRVTTHTSACEQLGAIPSSIATIPSDSRIQENPVADWEYFVTRYFGRNEVVKDRFLSLFPTGGDLQRVSSLDLPLLLSKYSIPEEWVERIVGDFCGSSG